MTRISYIHGPVPQNEVKDRAAEVKPLPYFNPLLMTEGQAYLTLMRDQVLTLAQYYPDRTIYKKGLALINNALHKGVNGIAPAVGAVEPTLYPVMRAIDVFKTKTYAAVRPKGIPGVGGSWRMDSMVAGIGTDIIPEENKFFEWWYRVDKTWLNTKKIGSAAQLQAVANGQSTGTGGVSWDNGLPERRLEFEKRWNKVKFVVDLYNDKIEQFAYHPLYNYLPKNNVNQYPSEVITKNILHGAGVEACAKEGEFSNENMALWLRTGILRANIKGDAGAISPEQSIFSMTGLPQSAYKDWLGGSVSSDKWKKVNGEAIGVAFVVLIPLIIAAIAAASTVAVAIINANDQASALNSVQGWGTNAYAASEEDWKHYQDQLNADGANSNLPLIIGGGIAAYLAFSK